MIMHTSHHTLASQMPTVIAYIIVSWMWNSSIQLFHFSGTIWRMRRQCAPGSSSATLRTCVWVCMGMRLMSDMRHAFENSQVKKPKLKMANTCNSIMVLYLKWQSLHTDKFKHNVLKQQMYHYCCSVGQSCMQAVILLALQNSYTSVVNCFCMCLHRARKASLQWCTNCKLPCTR